MEKFKGIHQLAIANMQQAISLTFQHQLHHAGVTQTIEKGAQPDLSLSMCSCRDMHSYSVQNMPILKSLHEDIATPRNFEKLHPQTLNLREILVTYHPLMFQQIQLAVYTLKYLLSSYVAMDSVAKSIFKKLCYYLLY